MALNRFPITIGKYASMEINRSAARYDSLVPSQSPLGDYFADPKFAENGMWVGADCEGKSVLPVAAVTDMVGILGSTEYDYDTYSYALSGFHQKAGDYPRIYILHMGDVYTTNCFQYDDTEFANMQALETALAAIATTPLYVVPVAGDPVPQVTATAPGTGTYGRVSKYYTVPNGDKGIEYSIVKVRV